MRPRTFKELLPFERIDVLTPNGKERLRDVRRQLGEITDKVVRNIPLWADLPVGRAFSRNAERGRKAFALAGQRIYIGGLSRRECNRKIFRGAGCKGSGCRSFAEFFSGRNHGFYQHSRWVHRLRHLYDGGTGESKRHRQELLRV